METIVFPAAKPCFDRGITVRRRVRCHVAHLLAFLLTVACAQKPSQSVDRDLERYGDVPKPIPNGYIAFPPRDSLEIRRRADSVAALDPTREARAAIARGDTRYVAICAFTCVVIGLLPDSICLAQDCAGLRRSEVLTIEGTEMSPLSSDVARLDSITTVYGARYNAILHDFRTRSARRFPPPGQHARYHGQIVSRGLIIS